MGFPKTMKPIAISVCVNYSDFLCWTIPMNKHLFERWIIVTSTDDKRTQKIAEHYELDVIATNVFYKDGATFNKAAAINEGLNYVKADGQWILFLDSDIVLPPQSKRVFEQVKFDSSCLYGVDRLDCGTFNQWVDYMNAPDIYEGSWLLTTGQMEVGARIIHLYGQEGDQGKFGGYKPLGFFQLANTSSFNEYPQGSQAADHTDIQFANLYPREKRILIPEIYGLHLSSEPGWGSNWNGRKTAEFKAYKQ